MKFAIFLFGLSAAVATAFSGDAFSRYDANGDGTVTFAELARLKKVEFDHYDKDRDKLLSIVEFSPSDTSSSDIDLFAIDEFTKIDTDSNHSLSPVEFGNYIRNLINRLDTDADNAVSAEEYESAVRILRKEKDSANP